MNKGFTLIELLVVIAILAILAVAVVLVINPAQLLRESRDVTRISDLNTLNNAIALYLADNSTTSWNGTYTGGSLAATTTCTSGTIAPTAAGTTTCTLVNIYTTSGTGWVYGVPLTSISLGSPLGSLPKDPNNGSVCDSGDTVTTCLYSFKTATSFGKYKLMANMESDKYQSGGTGDVESNTEDGGTVNYFFEVGTDMTL